MGLLDLFRGKQLVVDDEFFGEIITDNVKSKDMNKPIDWYGEYVLEGYEDPTFIILVGNKSGFKPALHQKVKDFVSNWGNKYKPELNRILADNPDFSPFLEWEKLFCMSLISSNEDETLEISFDPYDEKSERWMCFDIIEGKISEFDGE